MLYRSDDGLGNGPKLVNFVINCFVYDGTPLDTFNDLSTTGMYHLKILTKVLGGDGWSAQRSGSFTSGKEIRYSMYRKLSGFASR
jgi:hypothetical protein